MTCEAVNMVKHWLKDIGCNGYIEQFLDNGYDDLDICKQIGIKDIEAIGINSPEDRIRLLAGVASLKDISNSNRPFYFVLENPKEDPSLVSNNNKLDCKPKIEVENDRLSTGTFSNNNSPCSWACCTTLSSVSSGTSDYTSNCSHNSMSLETEPLVLRSFRPFATQSLAQKACLQDFPQQEVTTTINDVKNNGDQNKSRSSVVDMESDDKDLEDEETAISDDNKPARPLPNLYQSSSYTTNYNTVEHVPWRRSVSENCYMMSACGHHNRSVPPPLPRCPPPSASCIDMSQALDVDTITTQPNVESSSGTSGSERGHSFPRTTGVSSLPPQHFDKGYWSTHGQPPGHRKHKGLARIFSIPRFTSKKYTYKPARGDLSAREMTMSDEDRIHLMVMVKEGKLSMQQALNTVKQYEEDKKKGVHQSVSDYLYGDGIKMPVCADKSAKSSPLRFLRSFSFRNSKRKKFLQDLEYYYKEQEKRQRGLVERMSKLEICEESTYARPQCCSSKSCQDNGQSMCRGGAPMSPPLTSPISSPFDNRTPCYSTCGSRTPLSRKASERRSCSPYMDNHGSTMTYEMKGNTSEMSFRGSPQYNSVYNSPVRSSRRFGDDDQLGMPYTGYPSPRFCRSESEPTYFDRTYGGRHSYHGSVPPRRHSEVVTFVHHVQPSAVSAYSRTVCSKCQRQSVCDNQLVLPPCGGYMNYGPSPCCRHRGVVTNVIAEECSPCLSNSSSIEDVNLSSPRSLSVKANVHRADTQLLEDSVNNNSFNQQQHHHHQRRASEVSQRSNQDENKLPPANAHHTPHHQGQSPASTQPWSSGSSSVQSSQQSVSTESELPIEQYKPKGQVSPSSQKVKHRGTLDENDNAERNETGGIDLQENYAQTSDLVINTAIVQSVQQLCGKLGLQHLLPLFLSNGFETLELFKQLEESDLCTLGITDATERAKILTAVTLLPDEQEVVPSYKYKFVEDKELYSKINPLEQTNNIQSGQQHCVQLSLDQPPVTKISPCVMNAARDRQPSPVYGAGLQTRDSGCYMEHLNNSNQSH